MNGKLSNPKAFLQVQLQSMLEAPMYRADKEMRGKAEKIPEEAGVSPEEIPVRSSGRPKEGGRSK